MMVPARQTLSQRSALRHHHHMGGHSETLHTHTVYRIQVQLWECLCG